MFRQILRRPANAVPSRLDRSTSLGVRVRGLHEEMVLQLAAGLGGEPRLVVHTTMR
jgi:hypothetical protein